MHGHARLCFFIDMTQERAVTAASLFIARNMSLTVHRLGEMAEKVATYTFYQHQNSRLYRRSRNASEVFLAVQAKEHG